MLVVEIALGVAAGIVLAYVCIAHQRTMLGIGGAVLAMAVLVVVTVGIIWGGSAGVSYVRNTPSVAKGFWTFATLAPVFALGVTGSLGMIMLIGLLFGRRPKTVLTSFYRAAMGEDDAKPGGQGCAAGIGLFVVTLAINFAVSFPVWSLTPVGQWYAEIDRYGRANGWEDGLSILFGMLLWQWVWLPLGAYFIVQHYRRKASRRVDGSHCEPDGEQEA